MISNNPSFPRKRESSQASVCEPKRFFRAIARVLDSRFRGNDTGVFLVPLLTILMIASPLYASEININKQSTLIDEKPAQDLSINQPAFAKVIDDLPLMPGLELLPDNDVLFVVPRSGRIAETMAQGVVDIDDVYKFYRQSLPGLGWKKLDARSYQRENDVLTIEAHADEKITTVRFEVKPAEK